jgi:hypothetical protein
MAGDSATASNTVMPTSRSLSSTILHVGHLDSASVHRQLGITIRRIVVADRRMTTSL